MVAEPPLSTAAAAFECLGSLSQENTSNNVGTDKGDTERWTECILYYEMDLTSISFYIGGQESMV
jgi:hypothetical protein